MFDALVLFLEVWLIDSKDPTPPTCVILREPNGLGDLSDNFFRHRLGTLIFWILVPTWHQLAPQLGGKIQSKSLQEPCKIRSKSHLIFDNLLHRFLIDLLLIFDPQIK